MEAENMDTLSKALEGMASKVPIVQTSDVDIEHVLYALNGDATTKPPPLRPGNYLLKLDCRLATLEDIRAAEGQMVRAPMGPQGEADNENTVHFALVTAEVGDRVRAAGWKLGPTLGCSSTLPHLRLNAPLGHFYPLRYFFYGDFQEPEKLGSMLEMGEEWEPEVVEAKVRGARLLTWSREYEALVDGEQEEEVTGISFVVENRELEDRLREYVTDEYEVVRCDIFLEGVDMPVLGKTFRFKDVSTLE